MCFNHSCGCRRYSCSNSCNQESNNGNNGIPVGYLYAPVSFYSNAGNSNNNCDNGNTENSGGCSCNIAFIRCSDCFTDSCCR